MSFGSGDSSGVLNTFQKKFVSQDDLDEKRKKRQEEWEKVRKPEDPKEAPEEEYDNRSLFERLEEQKNKKEEEYQEQWALKNQVKGLEEDEVEFLDFVSKRQEELDKERLNEDREVLNEYRSAIATENLEKVNSDRKASESKASRSASQGKRSQHALLMGAVKRKSTLSNDELHEDKTDENPEKKQKISENMVGTSPTSSALANNGFAKIIGILPGLGAYDDSSDEKDSSSDSTSDDEEGLGLMAPRKVVIAHQQ
ncbi:PSME3-interacting protein-like [Lineus longissimus]|uniref:PSME3-interacting protein-like n=1 Tax=Lineus longissimus TaxID=88925 RepID=UPI00315DDF0E